MRFQATLTNNQSLVSNYQGMDELFAWDLKIESEDTDWERLVTLIGARYSGKILPIRYISTTDIQMNRPAQSIKGDLQYLMTKLEEIERYPHTKDIGKNTVKHVGMYLFDTLFGEGIWKELTQEARTNDSTFIEISLAWGREFSFLHSLPWEMLHDHQDFIVARKQVAITRMILNSMDGANMLQIPPKILFVSGSSIFDRNIRPAAEFLGLMNRLKRSSNDRTVITRLIERPTLDDLREEINEFRPSIVHFMCHGGIDKDGVTYLELAEDRDTESSEFMPKSVYPIQLSDILIRQKYKPQIVVLSVCQSGYTFTTKQIAPFAVELIVLGIPIVIGMNGEVSSKACRLFTRRFGDSILKGENLITATAEGRCGIVLDGDVESFNKSPEWSFPVVFINENTKSSYKPVPQGLTADELSMAELSGKLCGTLDFRDAPVFCGREHVFTKFKALLNPSHPRKSLILYSTELKEPKGIGLTRTLEELISAAVKSNHIPCYLKIPPNGHPQDSLSLSLELLMRIYKLRAKLRVAPAKHNNLLSFLAERYLMEDPLDVLGYESQFDDNELHSKLIKLIRHIEITRNMPGEDARKTNTYIDRLKLIENGLIDYLRDDFVQFLNDVRDKYSFIDTNSRLIFFLDDIHRFSAAFVSLIGGSWIDEDGFGNSFDPMPVVMSVWTKFESPDSEMKELMERIEDNMIPWAEFAFISRFSEDEELLALQWVMLNPPVKDRQTPLDRIPAAFCSKTSSDARDQWLKTTYKNYLRWKLDKGFPINFYHDAVSSALDFGLSTNIWCEVESEDWLEEKLRRNQT